MVPYMHAVLIVDPTADREVAAMSPARSDVETNELIVLPRNVICDGGAGGSSAVRGAATLP